MPCFQSFHRHGIQKKAIKIVCALSVLVVVPLPVNLYVRLMIVWEFALVLAMAVFSPQIEELLSRLHLRQILRIFVNLAR